MPDPLPISACLIAKNAAHTLPRCLASLTPLAAEIIVVHNSCTDDTVAIAQAAGARTIEKEWLGYREQKNFTASQATMPWILTIDADEEISPALAHSIREFIGSDDNCYVGASSPRVTWLINRWIRHGDWYPDTGIRLFRRGQGHWTGGQSRNAHYARIAAQELFDKKKSWSWKKAFLHPIWRFLRGYIFRLGFLDGVPGFLIAWQNAQTVFLRAAYHYELTQKPPLR